MEGYCDYCRNENYYQLSNCPWSTTPHFSVVPFPVALISSSEVTVMSLAPLQDTGSMDRNQKRQPIIQIPAAGAKNCSFSRLHNFHIPLTCINNNNKKIGNILAPTPHSFLSFLKLNVLPSMLTHPLHSESQETTSAPSHHLPAHTSYFFI